MDTSLAKKLVVFFKKKLCSKFHNEDQLYANCLLHFPITYCQPFSVLKPWHTCSNSHPYEGPNERIIT